MTENQKVLSPLLKFENAIRRILFTIVPNLGKYDSVIYARVLKVNVKGGKVDATDKRFSVDVQPLQKDLSVNRKFEKIIDVPLDCQNFGGGGVVYIVPAKNAVVRLAFMYNDPSFPYIESITSEGVNVPAGSESEVRIQTADGTILQIKGDKINIKTASFNTDLETIISTHLSHTHLGNMGAPTGTPATGVPPTTSANFKTGTL